MALTPERKLKKAVVYLMRDPLFADMSGIFMLGTKSIDDNCPTAYTNGRDEVYGSEFVKSLDITELAFVVVHESYHKMLRQLTTWNKLFKEDARLANMAADYVVNLAIVNRDPQGTIVKMPMKDGEPMGLLDRRFAGMHTKQVFDILKQEQKQKQGGGQGAGQSGASEGFDEHDWEGANELTQEEKEQLAKEVDQAIRQGQITAQKMHGTGGGNLDRELMDLLNPKVDWRELLREFVSAVCNGRDFSSWRKPNRRFLSSDIIMPSLVSERVGHMVVGIDTSGSIGGPELARFLTEVKEIAEKVNPDKVDLIYWDAHVAGHEVYNSGTLGDLLNSTRPRGGGGTLVSALFDYVDDKLPIPPEVCIVLTDGYTPWPSKVPDYPVMFAICGSNVVAPFGKTIRVED
jgi:predicted metal-dependent peptidase